MVYIYSVYIDDQYRNYHMNFSKNNPFLDPLNSRWRTAAILKIVFSHNSAAGCPISVKFCVGKQFLTEFKH